MPGRFCMSCGELFDMDSTGTMRCPGCQQSHDRNASRQRDQQRPSPAQRGYGHAHRALRAKLLAAFVPGQACARCGQPITSEADADLGHASGQQGYRGLEHRRCNRGAPGRARRR